MSDDFVPRKLDDVVKEHCLAMLKHYNGNKSKTSWELGISDRTLFLWLHKWGLFTEHRKLKYVRSVE